MDKKPNQNSINPFKSTNDVHAWKEKALSYIYSWHIEVHSELLENEVSMALQEIELGDSQSKID